MRCREFKRAFRSNIWCKGGPDFRKARTPCPDDSHDSNRSLSDSVKNTSAVACVDKQSTNLPHTDDIYGCHNSRTERIVLLHPSSLQVAFDPSAACVFYALRTISRPLSCRHPIICNCRRNSGGGSSLKGAYRCALRGGGAS